MEKQYLSTIEVAAIMGISREAVLKQIKSGKLPAERVGRNYIIGKNNIKGIYRNINEKEKKAVIHAVDKIIKEFEPALKKLGEE